MRITKRRNATTRVAIRAAINAAILGNAGLISKNSAARMICGLINIAISAESGKSGDAGPVAAHPCRLGAEQTREVENAMALKTGFGGEGG